MAPPSSVPSVRLSEAPLYRTSVGKSSEKTAGCGPMYAPCRNSMPESDSAMSPTLLVSASGKNTSDQSTRAPRPQVITRRRPHRSE